MKSFKMYLETQKGEQHSFDVLFDDIYSRGIFGWEMDKELMREIQYRWYLTFKKLLVAKDYESLICVLIKSPNSRITREWFNRLTGYEMREKSTQYIEQTVREFCNIESNRKTILYEWKRYVNMSREEIENVLDDRVNMSHFLNMIEIVNEKGDNVDNSDIEWMSKHLRLIKKINDNKTPNETIKGELTQKCCMLMRLGCDPKRI